MNKTKRNIIWIVSLFTCISMFFLAFNNRSKIMRAYLETTCNKIYVAYSTDTNYIFPTLVSMTSLMENANKKTFCKFYILHNEINDKDKEKLNSISSRYRNCTVNLVDMKNEFSNSYLGGWATPMYFRILLPDIIGDQNHCLYLDGDTIVRHDLKDLFKTDISNFYIAGVRDWNGYINKDTKYYDFLGIKDLQSYVCSGVLLMNLEKMRNDKVCSKLKDLVSQNDKNDKDKKFHFPDQDAFNKGCYGYIKPLSFKFGALTHAINNDNEKAYIEWIRSSQSEFDEMKNDPTIVHFTGGKPWSKIHENVKKFCEEWWKYAEKTGYGKEISEKYPLEKK